MNALHTLADRWPAIDALLDEALALPASERAAWLAALDGDKGALRDTMARLLGAQALAETGDFLGTLPRLVLPAPPVDEPAAGDRVGPWRLLAPLGRGGMGQVWRAERADGQYQREVALKLPRLAWGSAVAERLARERDILATLDHPHIARLYDAGVDAQGRPFIALELVHGQPIDRYCDDHALDTRQRVHLLLQVADAVSHAHGRLVVHRDLKPGNVLVTDDGQVRLLDFGIAKLMEDGRTQETALTRLAGAAMTLDYASPEQIRGQPLSTASDVYSLAALAFELLAGARPYRLTRGSAAELEEAIASTEPPLASSVARSPAARQALRGDLDAILNLALKKSPGQRYVSVDAFAADLRRHLQQQPVLARPDSRWYRTRRLLRRHRVAAGLSAAVALSVAGGAALATWQAVVARGESRRALAEVARQGALRNLYLETLTALSSTAAASAAALAAPYAVPRQLEAQLRQSAERFADRPAEWQALLEAVTLQLNYASDFERSVVVGREYLDHLKRHGADPALVINAHAMQGRSFFQLRRLDESEAERRAGLLWAPQARDERTEQARLSIAADLGGLLLNRGRRSEAAAVLTQADQRAALALPDDPVRAEVQLKLAAVHLNFDNPRALRLARPAVDALRAARVDNDDLADAQQTLALALQANGLLGEAEVALRDALRRLDLTLPRDNRNRVRYFGRLSTVLAQQGRHDEARQLLAQEIDAVTRIAGPASPAALAVLRGRALLNAGLHGDLQTALPLVQPDPLALLKPPALRDAELYHLAECQALLAAGRHDEAQARVQALADAWPERGQATAPWLRILETKALVQLARGDGAAAAASAQAIHELLDAHGGKGNWAWRTAAELHAAALARAGDAAAARRELAALDAAPALQASSPLERAESALRRAQAWHWAGDPARAAAWASAALPDLRNQHPDSPRLRDAARLAAAR